MIFVTVGMAPQGFERLIRRMDEIALKLSEKVIMQIGHTKYEPKNTVYFDFAGHKRMLELIEEASLVVCHDGAGTIIDALRHEKAIIVVPRMMEYGEAAYENKLDLASELEKQGRIRLVHNVDELEVVLKDIDRSPVKSAVDKRLVHKLREFIQVLELEQK